MGPCGWSAPKGLARADASGEWQPVTQAEEPSLVGMGMVGTEIVVADSEGLLRLDGDRMDRVWSAPVRGFGSPVGGLLVVSSEEVWATGEGNILQFADGRWSTRRQGLGWLGGSQLDWGSDSGLALAADGAVWAITGGALARFGEEGTDVIPRTRAEGWLLAGPDAGVWAVEAIWPGWSRWYAGEDPDGSSVSLVRADGTQTSVLLPGPPWSLTSLTAGLDGSIWVTICEGQRADYCTVPSLLRWDGQWSPVPHPGASLTGVAVTGDGVYWALLSRRDGGRGEAGARQVRQGNVDAVPAGRGTWSPSRLPRAGACAALIRGRPRWSASTPQEGSPGIRWP